MWSYVRTVLCRDWCPRAAVTNYLQTTWLKTRSTCALTPQEAISPKSGKNRFLCRSSEGESVPRLLPHFWWILGLYSVNSVTQSCPTLRPRGMQHARLPCPSPTPRACSNLSTSSQWCHPTISYSVVPFSSRLQSFPVSGYFQMSQFLALGGQSIGVSASASVLPMNIQDWSPLGWTGWISLQSKGLSRVFSNTSVQKHQFFSLY